MKTTKRSVLPAMRIETDNTSVRIAKSLDDETLLNARMARAGKTALDLRRMATSEPVIVPVDDNRTTYYHYFDAPGAEQTVVHFQPVANDLEHHPQGAAQAAAINALGYNVVFLSQNVTELTKEERKKVWRGDLSPLGEQRLRVLEFAANAGHVDLGNLALAGYSFGASDSAITSALIAEKGVGEISSAVFGEPANIADRSVGALALAFAGPKAAGGKQLIDSVLLSQDPALIELWGAKEGEKSSGYMDVDFMHFAKAIIKRDNLWLAAALRHNAFADDVERGISAMESGHIVLHKDHDSILTPSEAFEKTRQRLTVAAQLGSVSLSTVYTASEPWIGHAIGDNPWFWASLVRLSREKAA
ncbi:MAG: hypothetical protein U0491_02580 [Candidatus Saccharimonadales bacterium]